MLLKPAYNTEYHISLKGPTYTHSCTFQRSHVSLSKAPDGTQVPRDMSLQETASRRETLLGLT